MARRSAATARLTPEMVSTLGWSPADLCQLARRRLHDQEVDYLVDSTPAGSRERWPEQLHRLGAQVWWDPLRIISGSESDAVALTRSGRSPP